MHKGTILQVTDLVNLINELPDPETLEMVLAFTKFNGFCLVDMELDGEPYVYKNDEDIDLFISYPDEAKTTNNNGNTTITEKDPDKVVYTTTTT